MSSPVGALGPPRLAVSRCLLGAPVRYDGRHKLQPWLAEISNEDMVLLPICPEVEAGLGVPRAPIALYQVADERRVREVAGEGDHTAALDAVLRRRQAELATEGLDGFVFQARSPSCGLAGVPVHDEHGAVLDTGAGRFAAGIVAAFPQLPVAEAHTLAEPATRAAFLERVRAHHRQRVRPAPV